MLARIDALHEEVEALKVRMREIHHATTRTQSRPSASQGSGNLDGQTAVVVEENRDAGSINDARSGTTPAQSMPLEEESCRSTSASVSSSRTECLDQFTLNAPLSAVHAMTPRLSDSSPYSPVGSGLQEQQQQSHGSTKPGAAASPQKAPTGAGEPGSEPDVMSYLLRNETMARNIFALYDMI
jgi:hypothetical protein